MNIKKILIKIHNKTIKKKQFQKIISILKNINFRRTKLHNLNK